MHGQPDVSRRFANRGADLFNKGDQIGCYRVFQGLLWTVRPLLGQHPDLQKQIDEGMTAAERLPSLDQQAKALHNILGMNLAQYEQTFGPIALEPAPANSQRFVTPPGGPVH